VQGTSSPTPVPGGWQTDDMSVAAYDFALPRGAVAQRPALRRDWARLMVVDPASGTWSHARFAEIGRFLRSGDVLVVNDSKVVPARLWGRKRSGGAVEVLLVERESTDQWTVIVRSRRRPVPGATIEFGSGLSGTWVAYCGGGRGRLRLAAEGDLDATLLEVGEVPLPPYIRRPCGPDAEDRERYQTVYARVPGSIAAPTAGLHFTGELVEDLAKGGITILQLTLHVGPATFQPIRTEDVRQHTLEGERYFIPGETAAAVSAARAAGRRIIAVGTTTTRALEAAAEPDGTLRPGAGVARTVIHPGYRFRVINGLLTNFHLPRSSLLLVVAALLGRELVQRCYREALAEGYRFYSYGDVMLAIHHDGPVSAPQVHLGVTG